VRFPSVTPVQLSPVSTSIARVHLTLLCVWSSSLKYSDKYIAILTNAGLEQSKLVPLIAVA
jgi:hypothetical protein